jgi:hypothetical protein
MDVADSRQPGDECTTQRPSKFGAGAWTGAAAGAAFGAGADVATTCGGESPFGPDSPAHAGALAVLVASPTVNRNPNLNESRKDLRVMTVRSAV